MNTLILPGTYPEFEVRTALAAFWDRQMGGGNADVDSFSGGGEMDSLTACLALLDVEDILHVEDLPQILVKRNGYKTKDDFVDHLNSRVKEFISS